MVANEGGIGVNLRSHGLGLLYKKLSPSNYTEAGNLGLAEEIRMPEKAKGIIGVNVMVALSDFAELVKTSIAEKVDIIFSGAGLPLDFILVAEEGIKTSFHVACRRASASITSTSPVFGNTLENALSGCLRLGA